MSSGSKFSPLVVAVVLVAGLLAYLNWPQDEESGGRRGGATPVVVEVVSERQFPITIDALGTATANESVRLTAQKSAIVTDIAFDDGDRVTAGQVLLNQNNREEQAKVHELEINIQEAVRQERRIVDLARENAASEQLLDEQQARVKALRAQLEVANAQLAELQVIAPFSGVLGIRQVSVGALVQPGDVITTLDDLSKIKVDFSVAETHLPSISPGQQVTATSVAYPGETFIGEIRTVDSRVDPISRSIQVRAEFDNEALRLRPGMLMQLILQKRVVNTIIIPEKALVPIQDRQYVYVLDTETNKVTVREVSIGARRPGIAQVLEGLSAGEQIVVEGSLRIKDGSTVRVLDMPATGA